MNRIDLHNHTIASIDGQYEPEELVDIAIKNGIKYLAISDHDETSSIQKALEYGKNKDITIIPAIEISGIVGNSPIHILGYNIDFNNGEFKKRSKYVKNAILNWAPSLLKKIHEMGFEFDDKLAYSQRKDGLTCEELVGKVIFEDHRNDDNELLKPFREGGKLSDNPTFNFYKEFCAKGKPCFVPYDFNMDIKEVEKLIHSTGGKMFLAHPGHNIGKNEELLKEIIKCGIDGIEVFSSYHNQEMTDYFYQKAKEYNLYMSVGSDFHGRSKPAIKMGSINYDEEELNKTIKFILKKD